MTWLRRTSWDNFGVSLDGSPSMGYLVHLLQLDFEEIGGRVWKRYSGWKRGMMVECALDICGAFYFGYAVFFGKYGEHQ